MPGPDLVPTPAASAPKALQPYWAWKGTLDSWHTSVLSVTPDLLINVVAYGSSIGVLKLPYFGKLQQLGFLTSNLVEMHTCWAWRSLLSA